jgi:glycerophosphoryl diester phosphodiesterase
MVNYNSNWYRKIRFFLLLSGISVAAFSQKVSKSKYDLIAHRGGIVNDTVAENSREALENAIKRSYWMVEVDLRLTKDSVLITHHDANFKKYFGLDSTVSSMTWAQIRRLKSNQGYQVMSFEDLLKRSQRKIGIMIDNKISGNDTVLFARVIKLLKKYRLYKNSLMIGTDESTDFFTGKVKLSCTRKQLEENKSKPGYRASDYYLFSDKISREDVQWAKSNNILAIGVLNAWSLDSLNIDTIAREKSKQLKASGLTHFQIDTIFEDLFQP